MNGATGATGATGPSGLVSVATAMRADGSTGADVTLTATDFTPTTLQILPLWQATVPVGYAFSSYVPAGPATSSYLQVSQAGTYLVQYGVVAVPSVALVADFLNVTTPGTPLASCWIAAIVTSIPGGAQRILGAVPLAFTQTKNGMYSVGTPPGDLNSACAGYGQFYATLAANDQVQLGIFLATSGTPLSTRTLLISDNNFQFPFTSATSPGVARGATLTLMKIS